jgi:ubiquitin carboxyl-terminal hydrolase L3
MVSERDLKKRWIPLESDPQIFTTVLHKLGGSPELEYVDIFSLDPDFLEFIPRPVLGLILIMPYSETFLAAQREKDAGLKEETDTTTNSELRWFRQIIGNACGTYALLHNILNGSAKGYIRKFAFLSVLAVVYRSVELTLD